ncbi:Pol polyprotein [Plakobranchus ocellatus]|uniref:Pol polyprotein n=1 Tax=Plakobranchus ocellatus TaxID=259542 RepID=A0AAV4DR62_9GAST|nr:Pol polyprotein [Plakobranchus ocellatus]
MQGERILLRTLVSDRRSKAYLKHRGGGCARTESSYKELSGDPRPAITLGTSWLDSKAELDDQQADSYRDLLAEYQDVFAKSDFDLGNFTAVYHTVDTGQVAPTKQRRRRTPIHFKGEEEAHLDKMLEAGVVQPSPPVLVRKRDGSVRWCVAYRALNKTTWKDLFPIPRIENCVDAVYGNLWFSKLDANSAYWQVRLDEESKPKTVFCTRRGLFEFVRMPFALGIPATSDPFILDTDASDVATSAELIQLQAGVERVIGYGRYTLSKEQTNLCTTRKELLAEVQFTRQFRPNLLGRHFKVRTDHNSLRWLTSFKEPQGQLARWLEELSQYDMEIIHRPGKRHGNADALSRIPHVDECSSYNASSLLTSLPCGGCKYCRHARGCSGAGEK